MGTAISADIQICTDQGTHRTLSGDMDVSAGAVIEGMASLQEMADEHQARSLHRPAEERHTPKPLGIRSSS
ncbi:UxaA family hydrolase [Tropicimonas marinistellae]|uniref:UxaA family hydrolase n=1 Tax=Tropicimonas marinistellae TaxID=1739787 RepID=UPI00082F221F